MGHSHMFNAPQILETETDQRSNRGEHPWMPPVRGAPESSSISHPMNSMAMSGGHFHSQGAHAPTSSGCSSSIPDEEMPCYRPMSTAPQRDPIPHQSTAGVIHVPQENNLHHPSTSFLSVFGTDGGFYDQSLGNGRGSYKRKSPCIAPTCDRPSASRYYDVGSSSDMTLPGNRWQERHSSRYSHQEYPPSYRVNGLSIGGEGTQRNVRTRVGVDPGMNPPWNPLPSSASNHSLSAGSAEQSNAPRVWDRTLIQPPPPHAVASGPDRSFTIHDPSSLNYSNGTAGMGGYSNDIIISNRNRVSQNFHMNQPVRASGNGYSQRYGTTFRAHSSSTYPGHISNTEEHHNYHSSRARALTNFRLRNMERNGRMSVSSDRYRYHSGDSGFDRLMPESLVVLNQPVAFYGSRGLFDQHRDMRLDIDNMTYEDLLALGERIGTVNTGLSDTSISECLTASVFCSSEFDQDVGSCVICLEEYKNMDDVGSLKGCGHDFHVGCIRKWLSMKNLCPICKATAMEMDE